MTTKYDLKLSVRIQSFEWLWIQRTRRQLELVSNCFGFLVMQPAILLPQGITKYTVIRSPHVDKHSREQFDRRIYHVLVSWKPISREHLHGLHTFLRFLQISSYTGVEIEARICYTTTYSMLDVNQSK